MIDDVGVDRPRSARAIALPGPLTMAFLPYAGDVDRQAENARAAGHELLVHLPMEPKGEGIDPGPGALHTDQTPEELRRLLAAAFDRLGSYVGLNNHMGSRFTEALPGMETVLSEVAGRGLLFLDSRTTPRSVAAAISREKGVPFVARDVFIDHDRDPEAVRAQLRELEAMALRRGQAVGIGHPVDVTLDALAEWLPGLAEQGFALVPISALARIQPAAVGQGDDRPGDGS